MSELWYGFKNGQQVARVFDGQDEVDRAIRRRVIDSASPKADIDRNRQDYRERQLRAELDKNFFTTDRFIEAALRSNETAPCGEIEIFHNISRDASFGLNTVFDGPHKHEAVEDEQRHPLVLVFRYELDSPPDDDAILAEAWETFNVGDDPAFNLAMSERQRELAQDYRKRLLRSLSKGDVVVVQGQPYSCESGWRSRTPDELRIVDGAEAEIILRARYDFRPQEPLTVTVPWKDAS